MYQEPKQKRWPLACHCRIQRDERGTHFIDDSDRGFSFTCARDEQSCISNLLSAFTLPSSTAPLPINSWATDFVDELQPDQYLNGDAPIFGLRLTLVRTGAILSFSYSHVLAGEHAAGMSKDIGQCQQCQCLGHADCNWCCCESS